jgi:hypothetical protein
LAVLASAELENHVSIPGTAKLDFAVRLIDSEGASGFSGSPSFDVGPRGSFEKEAEAQVFR